MDKQYIKIPTTANIGSQSTTLTSASIIISSLTKGSTLHAQLIGGSISLCFCLYSSPPLIYHTTITIWSWYITFTCVWKWISIRTSRTYTIWKYRNEMTSYRMLSCSRPLWLLSCILNLFSTTDYHFLREYFKKIYEDWKLQRRWPWSLSGLCDTINHWLMGSEARAISSLQARNCGCGLTTFRSPNNAHYFSPFERASPKPGVERLIYSLSEPDRSGQKHLKSTKNRLITSKVSRYPWSASSIKTRFFLGFYVDI